VLELVKMFARNGFPVECEFTPEDEHESRFLEINSGKICRELGWTPNISVESAVGLTALWYKLVLGGKTDPHELTRQQIVEYLNGRRR
jgi:nucleoside-diphosphate-sugar epimerase